VEAVGLGQVWKAVQTSDTGLCGSGGLR
jgi:hypothetical protein